MSVFGFCNNKCKHEVYTKEEVEQAISTAIASLGLDEEKAEQLISEAIASLYLGTISSHNYSRGMATPSGGNDGDIYDQYFE
jgi:hypothetical protein